jgi:sulfotransferase family protein
VDPQSLIDAACHKTGLSDFGADTWREGLEVLVRSMDKDADLNAMGQDVMADQLTGILANRLEVESWHRRYPEIAEQPITAPLFGLGLPRTGSTALSFLLALDPAHRSLRGWEASQPCPPPETATEHTDPRIAGTQAGIDMLQDMFPDFVGMLPTSATGPQECLLLLGMDFRSMLFDGMARVPSYIEWLFAVDMGPAYDFHRRVLQLLQWRCPPTNWWLKTPSHMHSIIELDQAYPDARFVMTHRDITKVIPSVAAVMSALSSPLSERPDPAYLGRHNADVWETALRRLIAFRDAGNEDRFFDIAFADMQTEPMEQISRLYEWLGRDPGDEARQAMAAWWEQNSRERHGSHSHQASDFGLDAGELRERFAFYTDRFDVAPEAVRGSL